MMLLEERLNREAGNKSFVAKKPFFAQSAMATAATVSRVTDDWDAEKIQNRQSTMARNATGIWRVAQLH
jgi:hypothetical protein